MSTIILAAAPAMFAQPATKKELVIGATAGCNVDVLKLGVQPQLEKKGYKVELVAPLEAAQLPRSLGDVEHAIVNGNFAISSGLKLTEAVVLEKTPDHDLLIAAVKRADKAQPWAQDVADAFKTVLDKHFAGYARPAFLQ